MLSDSKARSKESLPQCDAAPVAAAAWRGPLAVADGCTNEVCMAQGRAVQQSVHVELLNLSTWAKWTVFILDIAALRMRWSCM